MTIFQALISGVVQGLTEFLPVSSSGHLVMLHTFFGFDEPLQMFDIYLHVGTLLAIIVVFRDSLMDCVRNKDNLGLWVVIGSVPAAIVGIAADQAIEHAFMNVRLVGYMLIVTGLWLLIAEGLSRRRGVCKTEKIRWFDAIIIGLAQGCALLPGLSRSGSTIATGLICGVDRAQALRFSFCLAIPAMCGALLFKSLRLTPTGESLITLPIIVGMLSAFIVGLGALRLLIRLLNQQRLHLFSWYCIPVGLFLLLVLH